MRDFFLATERLKFSVWDEKDLPDALKLRGNPAVTRYIVAGGNMPGEQVRQRLAKEIETYRTVNIQYWPVFLKETGRNIGCCGLRPYDLEKSVLEMGVHLKEAYWGRDSLKKPVGRSSDTRSTRSGPARFLPGTTPATRHLRGC